MNAITLSNINLPRVEYQGQRVVTFSMIDEAHQRPKGTARAAFNRNKARFIEGVDYFSLTPYAIRTEMPKGAFDSKAASGVILTEIGYLMVVKPFNDDLSWRVQRELVNGYFRPAPHFSDIRPIPIPSIVELEAMPPQQAADLIAQIEHRSHWRHGKHGSAEMSQRKRELKLIRPALRHVLSLIQLSIPGLEVKP